MATNAEKLTELETELATLKAARTSALTGGSSYTIGSISVSGVNSSNIDARIIAIEKSIQRLKNGGRGIVMDLSARSDGVAV